MSNDKAALFDQVSKTLELVREGRRTVEQASRLFQAFNSDDDIQITPKGLAGKDGWYHIASNYSSATEAINATQCLVRWGYAERPGETPMACMVCQPVDCRVKPLPLGQRMTSAEIYAKYGTRLVNPNELFTFGANHPAFQRNQVVMTLWMWSGQLWFGCLGVAGGVQRSVGVNGFYPASEGDADRCVLLGE